MNFRQLHHRGDIVLDLLQRGRPGVACDVVDACEDVDGGGFQRQDVGAETQQHLRRGLATDAATDPGGGEEVWMRQRPALRDRVAHEDDAVGRNGLRGQRFVVSAEVAERSPVLGPLLLLHLLISGAVFRGDGWPWPGAAFLERRADGRNDAGRNDHRRVAGRTAHGDHWCLNGSGQGAGVRGAAGQQGQSSDQARVFHAIIPLTN
jgi:hypothetical protein